MRYFTEKELRIEDAPEQVKQNMKLLVEKVLDPLRAKVGKIKVSSGFRDPAYNAKEGGSPTSDHITGCATDIVPLESDIDDVFALLIREFKYNQVILEKKNTRWIHISYKKEGNKQEAKTAIVNPKTNKATYRRV